MSNFVFGSGLGVRNAVVAPDMSPEELLRPYRTRQRT
jgi:hypothetical protein